MKRLSDEEYNPESDPTTTTNEEDGVQTESSDGVSVHTSGNDDAAQGSQTDVGSLLPDGLNSVEGEIPDGMMGGEPGGDEDNAPTGEPAEAGNTDAETEAEEEADETAEEGDGEMEDVNASDAWLNDVTSQTGVDAEDPDEFVEKVRTMQRDVRGFSELEQVLESVPQAAQLMHNLAQSEGEIDPVDFYLAAQDVDGINVQAPSKSENPDEWADFKAKLNERQQKMKERRREQQELQEAKQEIKQDFAQAFKSFKKRKGLDDKEAEEFKERFAKVFYGDAEKGQLPRMDVFDIAYDALEGRQDSDTPTEETEEYKEGYNQAIEDMKNGGADGLPDLKNASGTGTDDGGPDPGGTNVPDLLAGSSQGGMNHDQF